MASGQITRFGLQLLTDDVSAGRDRGFIYPALAWKQRPGLFCVITIIAGDVGHMPIHRVSTGKEAECCQR